MKKSLIPHAPLLVLLTVFGCKKIEQQIDQLLTFTVDRVAGKHGCHSGQRIPGTGQCRPAPVTVITNSADSLPQL